jgi:twitching motility protein PilJ
MATPFRLPGIRLPLFGGGRAADPHTALGDGFGAPTRFDTLMAPTRFGDPAADAPVTAGSPARAARSRRFALPLIGGWPLRRQLSVLLPVIGVSLLLAFAFLNWEASRSATLAAQTRLTGDALLHSQRLAKAAPGVLRGQADAFRQFVDSRGRLNEAVAVLQSGGEVLGRAVDAVGPLAAAPVGRLAELWKRSDQAAGALVQLQPTLVSVARSARAVLDALPRLSELTDGVLTAKAAAGASAAEVAAAAQLGQLVQRLGREVGLMAAGEAAGPERIAAVARDGVAVRELVDGLLTGSEARRLAPAREGEARSRLVELKAAWAEADRSLAALVADLPKLQNARAADQRIAGDSEAMRQALADVQTELAAGRDGVTPNQWIAMVLIALAALAAAALVKAHYGDVDRRAAESDAQRAEAERLEQEAKRTNDQNQAAILRLMNELQEVADGDLTVQATVSEDITGAIADSVNYTVEELRNLVSRINATAELVADASSKAQTVSTRLQAASEQQSREIRETGEAVLRMASQINDVSGRAAESAQVARQSLGAAEQGRQAVQNSIAGMHGIREQIQETAKRIKRLGESSQEIGEIVALISDITEQTNVLALNAAIQAASAGEAGRGFTVVAEEVQRLAERSAEATRQIAALIRTIQVDTQDAVAAMERSTQGVVSGTRLSDEAGNALAEIGRVSRQLAELIQDFSRTTSRQAASAGGVAHSIQRILLVTEQTSEGTQQTAGSIVQLAELAGELKNSVSRFRVS